tara:strand:- start:3466 stop:4449 length:984 start_codon:yes stop_codon:yes gene_type:complete
MKYLVTGSSGHLGEALVLTLNSLGHEVVSIDVKPSPTTTLVGSIAERDFVDQAMQGVDAVLHPATLHKPHVVTHSNQDFVDTNISGTLNLLECAVSHGVSRFIFTSTTSAYGHALRPAKDLPAVWITEDTVPIPKNIYGITKLAAENLCELIHKKHGLPILILRTSRFFPEEDDDPETRARFPDGNTKTNEYLYRRVELEDVVSAHLAALEKAPDLGFEKFVISATTPFTQVDLEQLRQDPTAVVAKHVPEFKAIYEKLGWNMFDDIERVYVNSKARDLLGWQPRHDFASVIKAIAKGADPRSAIAQGIGIKGYHEQTFEDGPFPVE